MSEDIEMFIFRARQVASNLLWGGERLFTYFNVAIKQLWDLGREKMFVLLGEKEKKIML